MRKEKNRLRKAINRLEKRGYTVPVELKELLKSGDIEKLKATKMPEIYAQSTYKKDGLTITGTERRKQERSESARKGAETRRRKTQPISEEEEVFNALDAMISTIEEWTAEPQHTEYFKLLKEKDRNKARSILNGAISQRGRKEVAITVQENAEELNMLLEQILYASGDGKGIRAGRTGQESNLARFAQILFSEGRPVTIDEAKLWEADFDEWDE